jgi:hypothetical protein
MNRITKLIALSFMIATTSYAKGKYENSIFSIDSLMNESKIANTQPLIMSLPASEGFAPNINIQIQKYPNSLDDYAKLSTSQFKQFKFKIIQNEKIKDALIFEYSGTMQGRKLHWYSMAYKKEDNVFLITATSTESQWKTQKEKLIGCVKSFKLK